MAIQADETLNNKIKVKMPNKLVIIIHKKHRCYQNNRVRLDIGFFLVTGFLHVSFASDVRCSHSKTVDVLTGLKNELLGSGRLFLNDAENRVGSNSG